MPAFSLRLIGNFFIASQVVVHLDASEQSRNIDILNYVDPLIGTTEGGHVFAGANLPFGMAKGGPDVNDPDEKQGGFATGDTEITGFSHMHDSGTGGAPSLGNFPFFVHTGCPGDDINNCKFSKGARASKWKQESVQASPGYFSVTLNTSIQVEVTPKEHSVLYRITFPRNETNLESDDDSALPYKPMIFFDLTDLPESRTYGSMSVLKKPDGTVRFSGNGTFNPSFGLGSYNAYFCADTVGEVEETGVFMNSRAGKWPDGVEQTVFIGPNGNEPPISAGRYAKYLTPKRETQGDQIFLRAAMSFQSIDQACKWSEDEFAWTGVPEAMFAKAKKEAEDMWREKLSVIDIDTTGVSNELITVFWSGTYRTMISPQDMTGENPLWDSEEPYYDSFYCIWDSFRSVHPLLTILDPKSQTKMVRALIDIYRHEGYLPDCRMSLCKGFTQGGSNADIVLADAFVKGLTDGIDWATGYEAVVKDAEVQPLDWAVEGRGGLTSWKTLGYIPTDDFDPYGGGPFTRSISRTVEYAYDDFCIAQMAKALGHPEDAEKYLQRSDNWKNMYKEDQVSFVSNTTDHPNSTIDSGFVGFLQVRYLNGTFGFQDPSLCSPLYNFTSCYLNPNGHETYEGSSWMYTFFVPQDMSTLITTLGGPETFVKRLQYLHTSGLLYIGDEQAFLPVFQFHYAGRPGLSAYFSHFYIPSQFNASRNGIPGNDDSGAMGSFTTLAMMGLWPVAGQNVYLITPPYFSEVSVRNNLTGNVATIRNVGFDPKYESIYIQSAKLNGVNYSKNWITHNFWTEGGLLELVLGRNESQWGTRDADLPPSSSTSW